MRAHGQQRHVPRRDRERGPASLGGGQAHRAGEQRAENGHEREVAAEGPVLALPVDRGLLAGLLTRVGDGLSNGAMLHEM